MKRKHLTRCWKFLFLDSGTARLGLMRCWGGNCMGHYWKRCKYLERCLQQPIESYLQTPQAHTYKTPWMVLEKPRKEGRRCQHIG